MMKPTSRLNSFEGFRRMAPGLQESVIYSLIKTRINESFAVKIFFAMLIAGLLTMMFIFL
tara:strand:- start:2889 stop:3068 length:180 start_codon:yes stop_codon:yes gene_type:complete